MSLHSTKATRPMKPEKSQIYEVQKTLHRKEKIRIKLHDKTFILKIIFRQKLTETWNDETKS